ncbi:MAG: glycosyltransferase family 4 protein [Solirubrobacteraceae bacterium]
MRVHVLDPSAYTPPYDHALCHALGAAGAEVTLLTSRFAYGPVPQADGYVRRELFYRHALGAPGSRLRSASKLAEHVPDMLRYRGLARGADVVHFQWLSVQYLDGRLLPARRSVSGAPRPLVLTAHDVLPREPRAGQLAAQRRLYERFDAIVVHSAHGRARLTDELGVDTARVHVIPHGVFTHLADCPPQPPPFETEKPVVLCFGLMRPYKGIDLLLDAWHDIDDAELWIAGMPKFDIAPLRRMAPASVRFVPRFIDDTELPAYFQRADLVVLPYREIDQSGVLFTALAFGKPLLLSDVGGFPEVAATGAARTFPAGDIPALHAALRELLSASAARATMTERANAAASGPYSWDEIARRTLGLYHSLTSPEKSIPSRP